MAGFIVEQPTWDLLSTKTSRHKKYRISDNHVRFYLRAILPHAEQIKCEYFSNPSAKLPGWESIMGLQFENLVLNNQHALFPLLGIDPAKVVRAGPFFQTRTARRQGCQIDLLIQTLNYTLYLCEVKFSHAPIGMEVAHQMAEKQRRLTIPRGWSLRPVLIHANGVTPELQESNAFDQIASFERLLG